MRSVSLRGGTPHRKQRPQGGQGAVGFRASLLGCGGAGGRRWRRRRRPRWTMAMCVGLLQPRVETIIPKLVQTILTSKPNQTVCGSQSSPLSPNQRVATTRPRHRNQFHTGPLAALIATHFHVKSTESMCMDHSTQEAIRNEPILSTLLLLNEV